MAQRKRLNKKPVTRKRLKKEVKVDWNAPRKTFMKSFIENNLKKGRKPWEGLEPGPGKWMEMWKAFPEYQRGMLQYRTHMEDTAVLEEEKKKREKEKADIEKFVAKKGVQKRRGKGEAAVYLDDDDDYNVDEEEEEEEEMPTRKQTIKKVIEKKTTKKPVKKEVKPMKKEVEKKAVKKTQKKEVMKTVNKPFGADGRTFDLYAIPVPKEFVSKKFKAWMNEQRRFILEFKDDELRAYTPERVTASGRVAKCCVKKQGKDHRVTFRSNKNSKVVE
jgi:hypothetical protein